MTPEELTRARFPPAPSAVFCWAADSAFPNVASKLLFPGAVFLHVQSKAWGLTGIYTEEVRISFPSRCRLSSPLLYTHLALMSLQIGMMLPVTSPNGNEKERKGPWLLSFHAEYGLYHFDHQALWSLTSRHFDFILCIYVESWTLLSKYYLNNSSEGTNMSLKCMAVDFRSSS